ncbi:hypothetical protein K6Y81_39190, partial [Burkholderia cenocepacia]|nr:hypothetical protein [Burkholderia cenocepacia]
SRQKGATVIIVTHNGALAPIADRVIHMHDEIVLEVPKSELVEMKKLVKQTMEEAIQLSVPLIADENEGATWYEAK